MTESLKLRFEHIGLQVPRLLVPRTGVDLTRWSVIACDQYTSEAEYWRDVDSFVGEAPSTLRLILPECYLGTPDEPRIGAEIPGAMRRYLADGTLADLDEAIMLVERTTAYGRRRFGLVAALDLERYDYRVGSRSLIRATEGTIVERLPARMRIRERAPLELPHIMVLYNDPESSVLAPLLEELGSLPIVYRFDLMKNAGGLAGRSVASERLLGRVCAAFERLFDAAGAAAGAPTNRDAAAFLFAVGDGNHSLAAAKEIWGAVQGQLSAPERAHHPARHALVELVNIYDEGLAFEPIHRVLFGGGARFAQELSALGARLVPIGPVERVARILDERSEAQPAGWVTSDGAGLLEPSGVDSSLATARVQRLLDSFLAHAPEARVDYIHGLESAVRLARQPGNIGFLLPPVRKQEFFATIEREGAFPRKTFSMGEASEKRFYLEARRITP